MATSNSLKFCGCWAVGRLKCELIKTKLRTQMYRARTILIAQISRKISRNIRVLKKLPRKMAVSNSAPKSSFESSNKTYRFWYTYGLSKKPRLLACFSLRPDSIWQFEFKTVHWANFLPLESHQLESQTSYQHKTHISLLRETKSFNRVQVVQEVNCPLITIQTGTLSFFTKI